MGVRAESDFQGQTDELAITYCVIPTELAAKLHDSLRRWFRDAPDVRVIVEQRHLERRKGTDRRCSRQRLPLGSDRRQIHVTGGRRVGERRAPLAPVKPLSLPRKARPHANEIDFFIRLEPSTQELEDSDAARLVARFQAGDRDAYALLYARYFDRTYAYLRVLLRSREDAEDATQDVFANLLAALPRYEQREQPFRAWLFTVARNAAVDRLRKEGRTEPMDPRAMDLKRERADESAADLARAAALRAAEDHGQSPEALDWITDPDLLIFVERLPMAQRRVLALRYLLDMSTVEIAGVLGRKEADVRVLQSRALRVLNERLTAIGRAPRGSESRERSAVQRRFKQAPVLRVRRFSLGGPPPPGGRGY